jgi:AcrR family transcriptional regulator
MAAGRRAESQPTRTKPYHHGDLRAAMLAAAERELERGGLVGLTLRGAAREAGASHAAPKNHFGDLTGLLSELAAMGFERFTSQLRTAAAAQIRPQAQLNAIGRGYVEFAVANPALFQLMFRSERLDATRPALRDAMSAASAVLTDAVAAAYPNAPSPPGPEVARAWSMVHGYAMLLLDGQLDPILDRGTGQSDPMVLLDAVLRLDGGPEGAV